MVALGLTKTLNSLATEPVVIVSSAVLLDILPVIGLSGSLNTCDTLCAKQENEH